MTFLPDRIAAAAVALGLADQGSDVDVAVRDLDVLWALRIRHPRLLSRLRYDASGIQWYVADERTVTAVDTLEDPYGVGRYAFPTPLFFAPGSAGAVAAYLFIKRGTKNDSVDDRTRELALSDPDGFRSVLAKVAGTAGKQVAETFLRSERIDPLSLRAAARSARRRRFTSLPRLVAFLRNNLTRSWDRLIHPAGLYILVVGPDGTGKSTLASAIEEAPLPFRSSRRLHWRPALLPRPRSASGNVVDHTRPHETEARAKWASVLLLVYHWLDSLLGGWAIVPLARWRARLVIQERGWWDAAADPLRYRLSVGNRIVTSLGRFLPRPDLVLQLDAPAETISARSTELQASELERQVEHWRSTATTIGPTTRIDVAPSLAEAEASAVAAVHDHLARRADRRIGHGWASIGRRGSSRLWIPRGPGAVAKTGARVYQPTASGARRAMSLVRGAVSVGGARLLPRADLPAGLIDLVAPSLERGESFAIAKANHADRFNCLIVAEDGSARAFAKVSLSDEGARALKKEAGWIQRFGDALPDPLRAPVLLQSRERAYVYEAIDSQPERKPEFLPEEVAASLGSFFAATGASHGDAAPWNLLRSSPHWFLIDWEDVREDGEPFYDLWHHIVQCLALLGKPDMDEVRRGLDGRGWIAKRLQVYAASAGVEVSDALPALMSYLRTSRVNLDPESEDGRRGIVARDRLTHELTR